MEKVHTDIYDKIIRALLYALVIAVPIAFCPAFHTVFSMPKLIVLRAISLAIMLLWGAKIFSERKFEYVKTPFNLLLLAYAAVSVLTTIFSITPFTSIFGAEGRFIGIISVFNFLLLPLFIINFLKEKKFLRELLTVGFFTSAVIAIYGILQYFGIFQETFNWSEDPSSRVFGTFGHGNHFGAYLAANFFIGFYLFRMQTKNPYKWIYGIAALILLPALILTASRGAMFSMVAAALIITVIAIRHRNKFVKKENSKKLTIGIASIILILLLSSQLLWDTIKETPIVERTSQTITSIQEGNIPDRVSWWLSGIEMFRERPVLGFGLSTFRDAYSQFRRKDYRTLDGNVQDLITPEAAHNEYLNVAATQGLFGFIAFIGIIIFAVSTILKSIRETRSKDDARILTGILAALTVMLTQLFFSFGVISTYTITYILLGVAVAYSDTRTKEIRLKGIKEIIIIGILVIISLAGYITCTEAKADFYYKQAEKLYSEGEIFNAKQAYLKAITYKPQEYEYYKIYAQFVLKASETPFIDEYSKLDFLNTAEQNFNHAIAINPYHPSNYYNLGLAQLQIYSMTGQKVFYEKAGNNIDKAVEIAVNNPLYSYQAAKAYMSLSTPEDNKKAKSFLEKALQIRPHFRDAEQILLLLGT
jgi:O-antigen ligase